MLSLLAKWKTTKTDPVSQGVEFQSWLKKQFKQNSQFIASRDTDDIAQIMRLMNRITPDEKTLISLYRAYDPNSSHEFKAWDLGKRADLMRAIETDETLRTLTDRMSILERYNELHAEIYGFEADKIVSAVKPPRFFDNNGDEIDPEKIKDYNANQMNEVISSGCHDRDNKAIIINTYFPEIAGKKIPTFHQGDVQAAALVLHEGRHTMMDFFAQKIDQLENGELKDVVTIHHLNTYRKYYLTGSDSRNHLNPCEKDAYDFQNDMQEFLATTPADRQELISKMEKRRDEHLAQIPAAKPSYPQPALVLAA